MNDREVSRCAAICSTHGQQCRAPAKVDGVCGVHARAEAAAPEPEADGDGEHVARVNELLIEAMNHPEWRQTPGRVRHLIEYAWVELGRATGDDS